jgi:Mg2+-importing ATPase
MRGILRFTVLMGAVSSLFDAITFLVLIKVFHADATLFQTGWFVESIATQILVIFLIRSRRMPWRANRPHGILIATSLGALGAGVALALGPWGHWFGFTMPSLTLIATVAVITVTYLAAAEVAKRRAFKPAESSLRGADNGRDMFPKPFPSILGLARIGPEPRTNGPTGLGLSHAG